MEVQPFECSLSTAASYRLGDPVTFTFTIRNDGDRAYQFLTWGTPLEQVPTDFLAVERDGEVLEYDGRMVKRGDPTVRNYETLQPGESQSAEVDISQLYPIDQAGTYTATLRATLMDAFEVPVETKQPPRRRASHQQHDLALTSVQFEVEAGGTPQLTMGQAARANVSPGASATAKAKAKAPAFNGGTSTQQSDTVIAHGNAQYFAALAASQLQSTTPSTNALYKEWFGTFDQGRYDNVTKHYTDISNVLSNEQVTYDITGTGCMPGYFAYTHKGDRTIWLCSSYLNAAQIGTDCKFGTLDHEWSHGASSTDDNAYGEKDCRKLAISDPDKATNNGDSHEYFCEHLAQSTFGKVCTMITDRDTFGRDEIDAMLLQGTPAKISSAWYVAVDGFWPDKLGITAASLSGTPTVTPTVTLSPAVPGMTVTATALLAEDSSLPINPQRFTWVYQVSFANDSGFPTAAGQVTTVTVTAAIGGVTGSAQIHLIRELNPYELDGPRSWLSTDLRVFQIRSGETRFGATMGSSAGDASNYIKTVLGNLKNGTSGTFDSISTDEQTSKLELASEVNGTKVFDFAIAKVRYRGTTDIPNVRTFFRLFPASTTSTEYNASTTYRRTTQGSTVRPLLGLNGNSDVVSIPCFAEPRIPSDTAALSTQNDPANVQPIVHGAGEVAAYFGCWLDINQNVAQFPSHASPSDGPWTSGRKSIQQLIRNAHQCLVAEIAFDPDPIPNGASPAGSDKLAQRNLSIIESANPGFVASRRIPNTFELRPTGNHGTPTESPDELMINWGNLPKGSLAAVYIPEIDVSQVIVLADAHSRSHALEQVDSQTLRMPAGGVTYLPIPAGASFPLTGLLTINLPETVTKGEAYIVVVQQITDTAGAPEPPPIGKRVTRKRDFTESAKELPSSSVLHWRRVVGSYQITIPVRTKSVMIAPETRLLSVLRWILESVPPTDRWYQVFSRYVDAVADRVRALGGDPDQVKPSPAGTGGLHPGGDDDGQGHGLERTFDGKVSGVVYDCFGDFEGFWLDDCGSNVRFHAREPEIERLVRDAWQFRMAISVTAKKHSPLRPKSITLLRAPILPEG